jgi:uncharacterized membrane protein (Fun14 family)
MWLFEQPLIIVGLGVGLILALGAAWTASGRKELLYALAAAVILLFAGLITERLVKTDKEQIRETLQEIARDVKANDHRKVMGHIHSSAASVKQQAQAELPKYKFTEFRITKIHTIDVDASAEPRSAMVELNMVGGGSFHEFGIDADHVPRWVQLHLLRETDGRWTVADYKHDDPQRMIMDK